MNDEMNKTKLLETLKIKRAEWDAVLAEVPQAEMTEPGVAGHWSVKDIIAHMNYHEGWIADRMHEALGGEVYMPVEMDMMEFDKRNELIYQQNRGRSVEDVLAESRAGFEKLMAAVQTHSEAFLIEPQQFEGSPQPVTVWKLLQGDVYEHYDDHIPSIKNWLASRE